MTHKLRGQNLLSLIKSPAYTRSLAVLGRLALTELGWNESRLSGFPVDRFGICPWFTYASVDLLDQVVIPGAKVLEVGSGVSTVWWALRGGEVLSIEASEPWAERTRELAKAYGVEDQIKIKSCDTVEGALSEIRLAPGKFNVVVNDGLEPRSELGNALAAKLEPAGILVWDNSDRDEYSKALSELRSKGFWELEFFGMGPINPYAWQTSVFGREAIQVIGRRRTS